MRARYDAPIEITAAEEGPPSSDARWNIGRHCTLRVLRASACLAPVALTQNEIGRTGAQVGPATQGLRKSVRFFEELLRWVNALPGLRVFLHHGRPQKP